MFRGFGTVVNVATVLLGSSLGVLIGHRLPERTREVVTDGLGLVTLLIAALSAVAVTDPDLSAAVGTSAPVLIVLGAVLLGGVAGSLLRIEQRLEHLGDVLRRWMSRAAGSDVDPVAGGGAHGRADPAATSSAIPVANPGVSSGVDSGVDSGVNPGADPAASRFIEGFVSASLVFCVGPLTVLGSLQDGLGRGSDLLVLKAVLDGFASMAFAASLGWGVAASALVVLVVQGSLTVLAAALGTVVPEAQLLAVTATGGLLLAGVALRLLRLKAVPVGDLLPALLVAPLLVQLVVVLR